MHTQINQAKNRSIWQHIWRFLGAQVVHTALTTALLAGLLLGAARAGALNTWLAPPAATTGSRFTTINYQGRLADSNGNPIDNLNPGVGMTFALYDAETGGTALWSETHAAVRVNEGLFSVKLGSLHPLSAPLLGGDRWLGVRVGADAEMTPREKLAAVPYAMIAGEALTVAEGAIGSSQLKPTQGLITATADIDLTNLYQEIPGAAVTLTLETPQRLLIIATFDIRVTATGTDANGRLSVDEEFVEGSAITDSTDDADRNVIPQIYLVDLDPGEHTLKLHARLNAGSGATVYSTHTRFFYMAMSQ